jgi:hypothetical protein
MKNLFKVVLIGLVVMLSQACSETAPTFEEQLEACLKSHFEPDSLYSYQIVDTVLVDGLDAEQALIEESKQAMETHKSETGVRKDSAIANLARAESSLQEITFDILIPFAEQNINDWKGVIALEENNLAFADSMISVNESDLDFISNARKSAKDGNAYYYVIAKVKGEDKVVSVSPDFKVLKEE